MLPLQTSHHNHLYTRPQLSSLKLDLQVLTGTKLSKITLKQKIKILCKTHPTTCKFQYTFTPTPNPDLFILESYSPNHNESCYFDQQGKELHEQMVKLMRSKGKIERMLRRKFEEGRLEKCQPKKLLNEMMLGGKEEEVVDVYGRVEKYEARKKLKKKFDNMVNQIKWKLLGRGGKRVEEEGEESIVPPNFIGKIQINQTLLNPPQTTSTKPSLFLSKQFTPILILPLPSPALFQTSPSPPPPTSPPKQQHKYTPPALPTDKPFFSSPARKYPNQSQSTAITKQYSNGGNVNDFFINMFSCEPSPVKMFTSRGLKNILDSSPRGRRESEEEWGQGEE